MIQLTNLSYLANQKIKDASVLLGERRLSGAIYLMGYAIELSLKRKIGQTLGFANGFPENKAELSAYKSNMAPLNISALKISDIKNHDLNKLIKFSGAESRIKMCCYSEWLTVKDWNPEHRYKIRRYNERKARYFIISAKLVISQID